MFKMSDYDDKAMASSRAQERSHERRILLTTSSKPKKRSHKQQAHRTATTTTAVLWAIFLYGLLQIFATTNHIIKLDQNSSHSQQLSQLKTRAPTIEQQQQQQPPDTGSNSEESLLRRRNDDGCNRRSKQLCSSTTTAKEEGEEEARRDDPSSSFITQQPLFSTSTTTHHQAESSVIHPSLLLQILDKLTTSTQKYIINATRQLRSLFGGRGRILLAEAASTATAATAQQHERLGIVVLNSTNFSRELLQNRQPFPHIKLIEFYVAHCSFCSKFKSTYNSLAREIYSWRNVIRPSEIDLGTNLAVAESWSITTVPSLRLFPPLSQQLASKIDKQLYKIMKTKSNQDNSEQKSIEDDTQDYLYNEYSAAKPMVHTFEPKTYLNNIVQFKSVLLDYIQSYVRSSPDSGNSSATSNYIPETWPNMRPVGEASLSKLLANHPRQELFLMIQGPAHQSQEQPEQQQYENSMAFRVMLELSSTASWKAVRYVKASENKALVEDVILQLKKSSRQPADQIREQVEILENFLMDKPSPSASKGNIVLVHTDDSQTLVKTDGSSQFAFISAMTGQELSQAEQHLSATSESSGSATRVRRDASSEQQDSGIDVKVSLLAKHISHTYTETKEDRKFIRAINEVYRDISIDPEESQQQQPTEETTPNKGSEFSTSTSTSSLTSPSSTQQLSSSQPSAPSYTSESSRANYIDDGDEDSAADGKNSRGESILTKLHNLLFSANHARQTDPDTSSLASSGDYFDKIKAIRYILFNEIPRTYFADKSPTEQQEKLTILLNLVSVIKSYFPMADSSSIQFMDGVHTYLLKQQSKLLSVNNQHQASDEAQQQQQQQQHRGGLVFDTRAFKQELKRLEGEDKRLPEVKEFKHCAKGGYPCALWRLFHTLTAFEYKKLNQIRLIPSAQTLPSSTGLQQSQSQQQQPAEQLMSSSSNVAPPPVPEPMSSISAASGTEVAGGTSTSTINSTNMINSAAAAADSSDVPSPGERLVSPPSTTTSLSLTIVGPSTSSSANNNNGHGGQKRTITEADLPTPVLLVMRDYITNFFGCTECAKNFQHESADLSLERIRHQEPAEFSILWLWETHNRVNKRLSVDPATNPPDNPKMWYPSYDKCSKCYKRQPSFLKDQSIAKDGPAAIFYESIEWNRQEILNFLADEYTKQPMDCSSNLFAHHLRYDYGYILVGCLCLLIFVLLIRCFTLYVERQRRHKATLLNGNGAHYSPSVELS